MESTLHIADMGAGEKGVRVPDETPLAAVLAVLAANDVDLARVTVDREVDDGEIGDTVFLWK